jgi:hypothetical protein
MDTDTAGEVAPFVRSAHMTYTVALDPAYNFITYQHYDVAGPIPCLFVLDKRGVIRWSTYGYYDGMDDHIKSTLNKILAGRL